MVTFWVIVKGKQTKWLRASHATQQLVFMLQGRKILTLCVGSLKIVDR